MKTMERDRNNGNMFIRQIYDKKKTFVLFRWIKYRKFLRLIDKTAPNFIILWHIADFIKILDKIYMYDNNPTNTLYSSNNFNMNENGFVIKKENFFIRIKLFEIGSEIAIEVGRSGSKDLTSIRFCDGENKIKNEDDEHMMINIENIIMNSVKELFIKYYKAQ